MSAELLVYALIAAGLIFWLKSILGTRHGDEPERPLPSSLERKPDENVIDLRPRDGDAAPEQKIALIEDLAENGRDNMAIAGKDAEEGLIAIVKEDREFDVKKFLRAAQDAFVFIVESFADGDRETLRDLLGSEVYSAFDHAITVREKSGEKVQTEIHAIKKSEIVEARMDRRQAYITVRFWAEQTSVTRDKDGEIIDGHPDKTTIMRDLWTFTRALKSRDPRWLVVETREDGAEDNTLIPDTH
ncbi:MAG: Tim44/TimA family putative adaptor protein [Alphaproteobacteria bacterium]|nr:Tim44/TimA family putative adaptor protein [Alphaproteobacteria bacterium]